MAYKIACLTPVLHIKGVMEELRTIGEVVYAPEAGHTEALAVSADANIVFVNPNKMKYRLDRTFILSLPKLEYIVTASTGTNHIELETAKERGIPVISLTTEFDVIERISSTAEHAWALTMALIRKVPAAFESVKNGEWNYEPYVGRQIDQMGVGVIGYGRLGRKYLKYASAFTNCVWFDDPAFPNTRCGLDWLLRESDIISLHVHVTDETRKMINYKTLQRCWRKPYLVNTSRGDVVDEHAVVDALRSGQLAGYATDVLATEFSENVLYQSPILGAAREGLNVIITPHIGGMTREAQAIAYNGVISLLKKQISLESSRN